MYRDLADVRHVALTLSDLGDALTSASRPAAAIASLREASSLCAEASDPYNQARILVRLGQAHEQAGISQWLAVICGMP